MMDTLVVQIFTLLILFLGNVVFGAIPHLLCKIMGFYSRIGEHWSQKLKVSFLLLYIGAGILISNTFIILLPQANREFEKSKNRSHRFNGNVSGNLSAEKSSGHSGHHHDSFPIPELTVLCGFFLAFMIQEFACQILMKIGRNSAVSRDLQDRFCTCAKRLTECSRTFKDVRPDQTLYGMEKKLLESVNAPGVLSTGAASNVLPNIETTAKSDLLRSSIITQSIPNYGAVTNAAEPVPIDNPLPVLTPPDLLAEERLLLEKYTETEERYKFLISSTVIVLELAIQLIISGMHFGLQSENCRNLSRLSLAFLQNFLLVFSAGSYLSAGGMEFSILGIFIGLLSTISPIGMIVSMVAKDSVEKISHLTIGVILSIISGTLLFSTFTDFLRQKDSKHIPGFIKFLALTLGAGFMAALQYAVLII